MSIIIVNWNSGSYLKRCLDALSKQTVKPYKVLIIDNSDDYIPIENGIKNYKIEVVRPGENIGFAAANNLGAEKSKDCDWIAVLNPDAFPEPAWLESLLLAAENNPRYSFFGSRLISSENPSVLDGIEDVYHTSGRVWRNKHGCRPKEIDKESREIFSACAAAALYRADAFFDSGGFDPKFFCYLEDIDLGFRLRLLGYRCLYVPDAVVYHVGSATTGRHSDFAVYHGHRNLVWAYFKNMPIALLLFYLPQHILLNILSLIWFSLRGQRTVIFQAKSDAIKYLPGIWRKRQEIQKRRRVNTFMLRKFMVAGAYAALKKSE